MLKYYSILSLFTSTFSVVGSCIKLNYCKKKQNKTKTSKREKLLFLMVCLTKDGPWVASVGWNGWGINILINTLVSITPVTFAPSCHVALPKLLHSIVHSIDISTTTTKQSNRGSAIQLLVLEELALPYSHRLKLLFLQQCLTKCIFVHGCPHWHTFKTLDHNSTRVCVKN